MDWTRSKNAKYRILVALISVLLTAGIWVAHLKDPSLLNDGWLLRLLAAGIPFGGVLSLGFAIFCRDDGERRRPDRSNVGVPEPAEDGA
jgi:hypothetical protein